jgi:phenylacetate-CoA ligase
MRAFVQYHSKNNWITSRKIKYINQLYELPHQQLLDLYNQRFLNIFQKAYQKSPFYRKLYQKHGIELTTIKYYTDIHRLPIIDRNTIKNQIDELYIGSPLIKFKSFTSGTSGSPLTVYRTPFDINTEQSYLQQYRQSKGYQKGESILSIRGFLGKSIPFQKNAASNTLYLSSPNIHQGTIETFYQLIRTHQPMAIEAFPSYLYKLAIELEKKNLHLSIPVAFTSSETLYAFQRSKIEQILHTKIYDWYGNVERTIGIAQDHDLKYKPLPLYSINEYRENFVLTTSLINTHFPLIRYKVDDRIAVVSEGLTQNIVSPDISAINGRAGDTIQLNDGSIVGCIDHAFKGIDHLDMAQIHVSENRAPLEIKLVTDSLFNQQHASQLRENLFRMLGQEAQFTFNYCRPEDLTYSPNQKFRLIIHHSPNSSHQKRA